MPAVCLYFQVHQPFRLHRFRVFDIGANVPYFDDAHNRQILERVAAKCYVPANRLLTRLIEESGGAFRIAMSTSGTLLEQVATASPEVLSSFQQLIATGGVELLGETYYHSLAALVDANEFTMQVEAHRALVGDLFAQQPRVFRNTELIFVDAMAPLIRDLGFTAVLLEGAPHVLGWRDPTYVYESSAAPGLRLLTRHFRLSNNVAFRFSSRAWESWPLRADTFADWLAGTPGDSVNLFMDYETFGEHQWAETGIFEFLAHLPGECRARGVAFAQPSELARRAPSDRLSIVRPTSWADQERDISAWLGNGLQRAAHERVYALRPLILQAGNVALYHRWQRLTTSDHFYYMATKGQSNGEVHAYFNAYSSPYDAFVRFMNIAQDIEQVARQSIAAAAAAGPVSPTLPGPTGHISLTTR